ncbi:hypothetical protein ACFV0L_41895 [Streptosporangium canum]|uniref:hypothetical protein n=1 Tax=Streptosporangium canum TaxID=324952 RepID=UPI0036CF71A5
MNSDEGVNRVTREGAGRYRVTLEGSAFASGTGYVQVTPYGDGVAARCVPAGSTPGADRVEITVACHTIGDTVLASPATGNEGTAASYCHHPASVSTTAPESRNSGVLVVLAAAMIRR